MRIEVEHADGLGGLAHAVESRGAGYPDKIGIFIAHPAILLGDPGRAIIGVFDLRRDVISQSPLPVIGSRFGIDQHRFEPGFRHGGLYPQRQSGC